MPKKSTEPKEFKNLSAFIINPENQRNFNPNEFNGLSPDKAGYYLNAAAKNLPYWKANLFDAILSRDLRKGAVIQTRTLSVANKEWKLTYGQDSSVPQSQQIDTIKFLKDNLQHIDLAKITAGMVMSQIQGVTSHEITYKVSGNRTYWDEFSRIPNYLLVYNDKKNEIGYLDPAKVDASKLRSLGWSILDARIDLSKYILEQPDPRKIINTFSLDGDSRNPFLNGCWTSLIWSYLFKSFGLKDFSIYIERYANPAIIGTRPQFMSKPDKDSFDNAVKNFGHLMRLLLPAGADLKLLSDEGKAAASDLFIKYVEYWDKEDTIRVLGQNLTTDISKDGSRAASETHDIVRGDILDSDMLVVTRAMNQAIRYLLDLSEANISEYPQFGYVEQINYDYKLIRAQTLKYISEMGYRPTQEEIEKEFNVHVEDYQPNNIQPGFTNYTDNFIRKYLDDVE